MALTTHNKGRLRRTVLEPERSLQRHFLQGGGSGVIAVFLNSTSTSFPTGRASSGTWVEQAVFGLDRWLRQWQGVYEYSDDPNCMFRIQRCQADCDASLTDGTQIRTGDPVLNLHLWNEHVPPMGDCGINLPWAREATRRVELSLYGLARHLKWTRTLDDIVAIRGEMRLGTAAQSGQLARIAGRYGFEPAGAGSFGFEAVSAQRLAENVFIGLLVLATNPVSLRAPVLRRDRKLVYLSRAALETRYAPPAPLRSRRAGGGGIC
jgi:hypothetical protein